MDKVAAVARETDPPFFPMDVWIEILLRIPAEDLVELKIVCKSWHELITSQSFACSHLNHWTSRRVNGFAVHTICLLDGFTTSSILYFTLHLNHEEGKFQCHNFLLENCFRYLREKQFLTEIRLLASCDGLLLIGYAEPTHYQLFTCNPITRSYKRLPIFQPSDETFDWIVPWCMTGSYKWATVRNTSTGKYKVFGMGTFCDSRRLCHVLELQRDGEEQSGHNWKELDAPLPQGWRIHSSTAPPSAATEGKLLWFAWEDDKRGYPSKVKMLSIDVLTDELRALASIDLLPEMDFCMTWDGTFYCKQQWNHEWRLWALENFDHPTWVEKNGSVCHQPPWSLSILTEQFVMQDGAKLVMDHTGVAFELLLEATNTGYSNCLIVWGAEKVVRHVNSLIDCS